MDDDGRLVWADGEAVFAFGKHRGRPLRVVAAEHPDYLRWLTGQDFPAATKRIFEAALAGRFPAAATSTM